MYTSMPNTGVSFNCEYRTCQLPLSVGVCRYSVAETVQLLSDIGIRDGSPFESNGITGGDLLDLDDDELKEDLHLTNLQVREPNEHAICTCGTLTFMSFLFSSTVYMGALCSLYFHISLFPEV